MNILSPSGGLPWLPHAALMSTPLALMRECRDVRKKREAAEACATHAEEAGKLWEPTKDPNVEVRVCFGGRDRASIRERHKYYQHYLRNMAGLPPTHQAPVKAPIPCSSRHPPATHLWPAPPTRHPQPLACRATPLRLFLLGACPTRSPSES
jgi:hypothetical protein